MIFKLVKSVINSIIKNVGMCMHHKIWADTFSNYLNKNLAQMNYFPIHCAYKKHAMNAVRAVWTNNYCMRNWNYKQKINW